MTLYRCQIQHWISGATSADKWDNTIYVTSASGAAASDIATELQSIFFAASGFTIYHGFYGSVTLYDMADAKPRPEKAFTTYTPASPSTAASLLPDQVALCLSFYATRNLPRQRGRIYIGPNFNDAGNSNVPDSGDISALISLATALHGMTHSTLQVYSVKNAAPLPVTNFWVDNRWDTQRRRLPKATARTTYP